MGLRRRLPTLIPPLAVLLLLLSLATEPGPALIVVVTIVLAATVLVAVHHAEVIAHRVGEPFGSLTLALAVTVIEVALILTLSAAGGKGASTLARDTIFAAVMITCNGIVGISLFIGAVRNRVAQFNPKGSGTALATIITLATVSLVLPSTTTSQPGPEFTPFQLGFAAAASLALYGLFLVVQTVRHRDAFLHGDEPTGEHTMEADPKPSARAAFVSGGLLFVALTGVVGLTKVLSMPLEDGVAAAGLPHSFVGVLIALLVLAPESLAAIQAARHNDVQRGMNLAYGSAMASIGLTIPAVAIATAFTDGPLVLGLGEAQTVLLVVTAFIGTLTVLPGRATLQQGGLHLVLLAAFVALAIAP